MTASQAAYAIAGDQATYGATCDTEAHALAGNQAAYTVTFNG